MPRHGPRRLIAFLLTTLLLIIVCSTPSAQATAYTPGVKVGDWWNYAHFEGSCIDPCPPGFRSTLSVDESTALVTVVSGTTITVKNTVAYNNGTIRTFITQGDLATGSGNLSSASSMLISGGLVQGDPIYNSPGAPSINGTSVALVAGANRTLNVLNDTINHRVFTFDRVTGVLVQFQLNQTASRLFYRLTGTNLWNYRVAIYDGTCGPDSPVSCGFNPLQVTVIAGTTISWNNTGSAVHSVDACTATNNPPNSPYGCNFINDSGLPSFASGNIVPGAAWPFTFNVPGQYWYYDGLHNNMKGSVTVVGNATTPPGFSISINPDPVRIRGGYSNYTTASVSASNGYSGQVATSYSINFGPSFPTQGSGLGSCFFYGGSWGCGTSFSIETLVNSTMGVTLIPEGSYTGTVTGAGNNLTRTKTFQIVVMKPGPYFLVRAVPSSLEMFQGTSATVAVQVQSYYGFSGTVSLGLYISPGISGFAMSLNSYSLFLGPNQTSTTTLSLNAPAPGFGSTGSSTITITTSNGTISRHGFLAVNVVSPVALLLYRLFYVGPPMQSTTILLVNNFTNIGSVPIRITSIAIMVDFGTFSQTVTPLLQLQPGQSGTFNFTITIPRNAQLGKHNVTATPGWQYYYQNQWSDASAGGIHGSLTVLPPAGQSLPSLSQIQSSLSNLVKQVGFAGIIGIAAYMVGAVALSLLVIMREEKRRRRPSPAV